MNLNNPAGKNWGERRPRRRPWKLGQGDPRPRLPDSLPSPGQHDPRNAAGRNWVHERPEHRRRPGWESEPPIGPLREWGGGDHDQPYRASAPSADHTFPFNTRQHGRLLMLRGRLQDGALADDGQPDTSSPPA